MSENLPNTPGSRTEAYLASIIGQDASLPAEPGSRIEAYLKYMLENGTAREKELIHCYSTMPTASADYVGKIVQYVGTTTASYTNGYFYICQESSGTYSWAQKNVQTDNDSSSVFIAEYGVTTASEVAAARTAGKAVFLMYAPSSVMSHQLMLVDESDSKYVFAENQITTNDGVSVFDGVAIALNKTTNEYQVVTAGGTIGTYSKPAAGIPKTDLASNVQASLNEADKNIEYAIDPYEGADLTVKFADEISNFSDEWAWIKNRKTTGNFEGLHTHDYIPVTCENASAYVLKMEIAGINTYKGAGASEIGNHIDFISKDCWPDTVQYNPVNYNNGICLDKFTADGSTTAFQLTHRTASTFPSALSAVKVNGTAVDASTYSYDSATGVLTFTTAPASGAVIKAVWATADQIKMPFLASSLRAFLMSDKSGVPNEAAADPTLTEVDFTNGGIWKYLPTKVKNVIIDKMGYPGTRLIEGTLRTSENTWDSANQGKLWLPCEMEVYGEHIWSTTYESAFGRQYPCFMNGNRKKGAGNGGSRSGWWLSSPYSGNSAYFCFVYGNGYANYYSASFSYRVPVCFRI